MPVFKKGNKWHYEFMMHRKRYYGSIPGARNETEAKVAEGDARHRVFSGKYGRQDAGPLMADFAKNVYLKWAKENKKSWASDVFYVKAIIERLGTKRLGEITELTVEKFKRDRLKALTKRKETRKPASVNRELACLSRIFRQAIKAKLVNLNPCQDVRRPREDNERSRYLLPEEEPQLLAALTGRRAHLYDVVLFALNTGARKGELLGLRRSEVDLLQNSVRFVRTKSGKDRVVPLNEAARSAVERATARKPDSEYVFAHPRTGGQMKDLKHGFSGAVKDAKLEDFHFHDLRHTFATRLAAAGVDAFTLKELLGHADLRMTSRYAHATDPNRRRAVETLRMGYGKVLPLAAKKRG